MQNAHFHISQKRNLHNLYHCFEDFYLSFRMQQSEIQYLKWLWSYSRKTKLTEKAEKCIFALRFDP